MDLQIYFVVHAGRIKVGLSRNVLRRVREVGLHLPGEVELLGSILGSLAFERAIHAALSDHQLRNNEWFRDCPETRSIIHDLMLKGPSAIGFKPFAPDSVVHAANRTLAGEQGGTPIPFGVLARLAWPKKTAFELSVRAGTSVRMCRYWLAGAHPPTWKVVRVVLAEVMRRLD